MSNEAIEIGKAVLSLIHKEMSQNVGASKQLRNNLSNLAQLVEKHIQVFTTHERMVIDFIRQSTHKDKDAELERKMNESFKTFNGVVRNVQQEIRNTIERCAQNEQALGNSVNTLNKIVNDIKVNQERISKISTIIEYLVRKEAEREKQIKMQYEVIHGQLIKPPEYQDEPETQTDSEPQETHIEPVEMVSTAAPLSPGNNRARTLTAQQAAQHRSRKAKRKLANKARKRNR